MIAKSYPWKVGTFLFLGGNFGPEKKYLAPSPQIPLKHPPGPSPHPPPPAEETPLLGFSMTMRPPPLPAPRSPLSPPPSRKKLKISETSTKFRNVEVSRGKIPMPQSTQRPSPMFCVEDTQRASSVRIFQTPHSTQIPISLPTCPSCLRRA